MKLKKIMILYLSISFLIISLTSISYAYFQKREVSDLVVERGQMNMSIMFFLDDILIDETSTYYDQPSKSYTFDITEETLLNHISRVKVLLEIDTDIPIKMRMKLLESYVVTRTYHVVEGPEIDPYTRVITIPHHSDTYYPYSLFKKGFSDTLLLGDDGYLYVKQTYDKGLYTIPLIDGGLTYFGQNHQTFEETGYVSFHIIVEIVQSNRYEALWGVDASFYTS